MDKILKKSYNKPNKEYRFKASPINKEDWFILFFDKNSAESVYELKFAGNMKVKPYPYKFYFLRFFFWFFKSLIYKNPISKLDKQSKRHITIVLLMILTILIMLFIAYKQGIFNDILGIQTA